MSWPWVAVVGVVKSISPAQSKSILKRRDGGEGMRMRRCRVGERKREKAQERERGEGGGGNMARGGEGEEKGGLER